MLGARTNMLLSLVPRLNRCISFQSVVKLSLSPVTSSHMVSSSCCQGNHLVQKSSFALSIKQPKRHLASDNKDDYIIEQNTLTETEKSEIESSVKKDFEDWVPYGFCPTDKEEDIFRYKLFMFTSLTLGIVIFLYIYMHLPPRNLRDWVSREAYLEIERRQRLGLPLVDKDLVPADQVVLPSLEELGDDYEIII